jgi:hypothetical protein
MSASCHSQTSTLSHFVLGLNRPFLKSNRRSFDHGLSFRRGSGPTFPSSFLRSAETIAPITRPASRAITLADLHEAATVDGFAIAPGNLNAEFTPKLVALGIAHLEH